MKLYCNAGTCSPSQYIVALEPGIRAGTDSGSMNQNDYVVAPRLDYASTRAESYANVQYLADLKAFMDRAGARSRVQEAVRAEGMEVAA